MKGRRKEKVDNDCDVAADGGSGGAPCVCFSAGEGKDRRTEGNLE